ncbi:hypothetical protein QA640_38685 [Bradyrhizobium sp. CB82]|uniref:hypothetical protein n=1 Tax=Bradyrhizobium sp. CB82 TaxID=3039159 RepID=UPI0024B277C4|nr:hypothetical protein [Bradyrhizobium sp. CB82]WFU40085.1 hypothetical protein QA640_38685 [Bradyrhizobium sp. CB82]
MALTVSVTSCLHFTVSFSAFVSTTTRPRNASRAETLKRRPDFPEEGLGRFGYSVAKVNLAAVPFVGDVLQEALERAVGEPLMKRQEEWFKEIGKGLQDLRTVWTASIQKR